MPARRQAKRAAYQYLPDVATADVCFEAAGKSLDELFANAGLATEEVMVDLKTVKPKVAMPIKLEAKDIGSLLYDFLEELVFLKDKDLLLFSRFELSVSDTKGKKRLTGMMHGEEIDRKRHDLKCDVKAVTLHMFKVEQTKDGWMARVVLDI